MRKNARIPVRVDYPMVARVLLAAALFSPLGAWAKSVDISVKGMVCSFCAQGIKKKFGAQDSVRQIAINLENHLVSLQLQDGKELSDSAITGILTEAGYSVDHIERK